MPQNEKQNSLGDSNFGSFALALALFLTILAFLLWLVWREHETLTKSITLESAILLRYIQYPFALFYTDSYANVIFKLHELRNIVSPDSMSNKLFVDLLTVSFRSFAIVLFIIVAPITIHRMLNRDRLLFQRLLSLDDLIAMKRLEHPRIMPATATNLLNVDSRFGPWASHLNPIELCIHRDFLDIDTDTSNLPPEAIRAYEKKLEKLAVVNMKNPSRYQVNKQGTTYSRFRGLSHPTCFAQPETKSIKEFYSNLEFYVGLLKVDKESLTNYYIKTLGEPCRYKGRIIDIDYLPPSERAIWMLLCSFIPANRSFRKRANDILDRMGRSFREGTFITEVPDHTIDFTDIHELYHEAIQDNKVKFALMDIAEGHSYYYTAFTQLFTISEDRYTSLIAGDFRWLKTVNRLLYFTLNQVGMDVARPETAGIRAHFKAELRAQRGLRKPIIDSACVDFFHTMEHEGYTTQILTELDSLGRPFWKGEAPAEDDQLL
ncbi:MAG: hypothetical protein ACJAS1_003139 [Oleiphilaceae bacterium]|jgi:hypothetical protein